MKLEELVVLGISHKEVELSEREKFITSNPKAVVETLFKEGKIRGYADLSTCLRIEYYLHLSRELSAADLLEIFKEYRGIFIKKGNEAAEYLFSVTCGFQSVIKGEDQILAQAKKAHLKAMEEKSATALINVLFNKAVELGKRFRNQSGICNNALSLEAISLKFIKNHVEELESKKVLILGVGDLAQSILYLLIKEGVRDITITNRTTHKALELKNTFDVNVITFSEKVEKIPECDIIISITSAPHVIIKKEDIKDRLHPDRNYFFLDLAVPRDIEDSIEEIQNVNLNNLDDVWNVYYKNLGNREELVEKYSFMIDEQMENLMKWFRYRERGVL